MQTTQGHTLQSLRSVKVFLDTNPAQLARVLNTGARQQLDEVITEIVAHASGQAGSHLASQSATRTYRARRRSLLRDHMTPIARIARLDLPVTPETAPLKLPKGRPTPERLAGLAAGMGQAAAAFTSVFTAAGLPDDFVAQLNAAASAMLAALTDRTECRGQRGGATKGLKTELARGRRIVHILDAFVKSALTADPALLAHWNIIKRVRVTPRAVGAVTVAAVVAAVSSPSLALVPASDAPFAPTPAPASSSQDLTQSSPDDGGGEPSTPPSERVGRPWLTHPIRDLEGVSSSTSSTATSGRWRPPYDQTLTPVANQRLHRLFSALGLSPEREQDP